ncbi:diaminopimelate decarboxylase [Candidatus Vidania fulgoroideorum]
MKIIKKIIKKFKTPIFIYKKKKIIKNIKKFNKKNIRIFYALKANYNENLIKIIKKYVYGFETVSIGEINFLLKKKINKKRIIFSGVCKKKTDLKFIKKKKISYISVESYEEFKRIIKKKIKIKIILKINLNIDAKTIKQITTCRNDSKFGITKNELKKIISKIKKKNIKIYCLGFHLGSQISFFKPYIKAFKKIYKIYKIMKKKKISIKRIINIGGGYCIKFFKRNRFNKLCNFINKKKFKIIIEPGRSIVADSCVTVANVEYIKKTDKKRFAILDVGMESVIRPALYNSIHKVKSLTFNGKKKEYSLVGPVCESTDVIKKKAILKIKAGDKILIYDTGAYCMSMRMNYNMRKKPIELIIEKKKIKRI